MGTTLTNGIYLPNEGEKNCYAGLKTNWEILDQKVADIAALQQAVAGALHREIVASLPTTDIDPNTIYMVLSGTSATENVYNEFMYVNNAWELIGTSATDLTNYYTKGDVDGLLLLKANASDLTSHTGDTTIHVTASDKSKWNTVALIKQLRLVNAQVGSATTIAFANIDDTNGIKVGDKCMDLDAKMFEITAVDTTNQTVTVGSALIDLALDANVVHTGGDETISGNKTFSSNAYIYNSDNTANTPNLYLKSSKIEISSQGNTSGDQNLTYLDKNSTDYAYIKGAIQSNGSAVKIRAVAKDSSDNLVINELQILAYTNGNKAVFPLYSNEIDLGVSNYKWKSVYAMNYYYGSNNVEFSTKFVTTDTSQTVSGAKTFSSNTIIYNSDSTANTPNLILQSSKIQLGDTSNSDSQGLIFNAGSSFVAKVDSFKDGSGTQNLQNHVRTKDASNNVITAMYRLRLFNSGLAYLESSGDNTISLGRNNSKWKDCQTYLINGLTPSSLGMPNVNINSFVDISGYFTNTGTGETNTYPVTANGWIYLRLSNISGCQAEIYDSSNNRLYAVSTSGSIEQIMIPVVSGVTFKTQWATGSAVTVNIARFIPCQGNI